MPKIKLESLSAQLEGENHSRPPIHLWHPEFSGDIDIRIDREGRWFHEGGEIKRQALVNLFASILRREEDRAYYLVTPLEKWRIGVEYLPLLIIDAEVENLGDPAKQMIIVKTNTGLQLYIGPDNPIELYQSKKGEYLPSVVIEHGLSALLSRAVYYQLAEFCELGTSKKNGLFSSTIFYPMEQ